MSQSKDLGETILITEEQRLKSDLIAALDQLIRSSGALDWTNYIMQSIGITNDISIYDEKMHSTGHIWISAYYYPKIEIRRDHYLSTVIDTHKAMLDVTDPQCFENLLSILRYKSVDEFRAQWT